MGKETGQGANSVFGKERTVTGANFDTRLARARSEQRQWKLSWLGKREKNTRYSSLSLSQEEGLTACRECFLLAGTAVSHLSHCSSGRFGLRHENQVLKLKCFAENPTWQRDSWHFHAPTRAWVLRYNQMHAILVQRHLGPPPTEIVTCIDGNISPHTCCSNCSRPLELFLTSLTFQVNCPLKGPVTLTVGTTWQGWTPILVLFYVLCQSADIDHLVHIKVLNYVQRTGISRVWIMIMN